jgi:hypothetical protein
MSARIDKDLDDTRLFVPESRIGFWFLGTEIWESRVIRVALADLERLIPVGRRPGLMVSPNLPPWGTAMDAGGLRISHLSH